MRFHREGTPTILLITALVAFGLFALLRWPVLPNVLGVLLGSALVTVLLIVIWFFRVPKRSQPNDPNGIIAPCDGKVVVIEEVHEPEYFKDKRRQVSIFMSPLNVHINYYPISGTTSYYKYHPGKYLVAWHPKSSTENERSTVVANHPVHGEVLFRQIAGALARRICTFTDVGRTAVQGNEFGFIKFGSRVDLLLPLDARIEVDLGQTVTGASTVIARFKDRS
ncbi:MAG: phosphatidylserine decarboxylase family protein [Flavobacteriales bacterium]|nr:phosphatidylserine decarboxylase family protein [Flavobacteriales bacterium]